MHIFANIKHHPTCDLCGADILQHGAIVATGQQELLTVKADISTILCRQCRFIFQPERFSDSLLSALYEKDTSFSFGDTEKDVPIIQAGLAVRQAVISNAMINHEVKEGAIVLDVGGGRGECCQHLVPRYRVVVADTTETPPIDHRIEKVLGLFSANLEKETFDVVVMNHVLEHVFSPTTLLKSAHNVLKVGGILIVEVPFELYTPLIFRNLGDWRHVAYFCRATLSQFLEKTGFLIERIVLEEGRYGVRSLPVIRAVARKQLTTSVRNSIDNTTFSLLVDMLSFTVLKSLVKRVIVRK